MHQDKFSLTWHKYSDHLKNMMKELMMNDDYSDVTLVTEDKKHLKANVNVLSACSPVFREIFKREKNSSLIMYLRGIQFPEMESILQFIYLGKATFKEERMDEFLAVAKLLEIKELCNAENQILQDRYAHTKDEQYEEPLQNDHVPPTDTVDEQTVSDDIRYACDECDYKATQQSVLFRHIQSKHEERMDEFLAVAKLLETKELCNAENQILQDRYAQTNDVQYEEPLQNDHVPLTAKVEEQTVTTDVFKNYAHQKRKREVVGRNGRYECITCQKKFSNQSHLTRHIQSKHEGVKYACNKCDYQATQPNHLTTHFQSKHEDIRYVCHECDYKAIDQSVLIRHIQSKHEGVMYACDKCDYQATRQDNLKRHIKNKH